MALSRVVLSEMEILQQLRGNGLRSAAIVVSICPIFIEPLTTDELEHHGKADPDQQSDSVREVVLELQTHSV